MRKLWTPLVSLLLVAWLIGGYLWTEQHQSTALEAKTEAKPTFLLSNNVLQIKTKVPFGFSTSSEKLIPNEDADTFFHQIIDHLKESGQHLNLQGSYLPKEINKSNFENLGLARAESVKAQLVSMGATKQAIVTQGLAKEDMLILDNQLIGAVSFHLNEAPKKEPVFNTLAPKEEASISPLNLYFGNSQYKIKMSPVLEDYINDLKGYLKVKSKAKVSVCGYSDNKGDRKFNLRVSKYRARKVRDFLLKQGIDKKRILLDYKGPDDPIATNDTEAGRKKNRRVEIRIK